MNLHMIQSNIFKLEAIRCVEDETEEYLKEPVSVIRPIYIDSAIGISIRFKSPLDTIKLNTNSQVDEALVSMISKFPKFSGFV